MIYLTGCKSFEVRNYLTSLSSPSQYLEKKLPCPETVLNESSENQSPQIFLTSVSKILGLDIVIDY